MQHRCDSATRPETTSNCDASQDIRGDFSNGRAFVLELIFLVVAMSIGYWLRFPHLADESLWTDEVYTLVSALRPLSESLLQFEDQTAPLYQLLLRPFSRNNYLTEWQLRAPAAISGLLIIPAGWLLARSFFGWTVGATSALLLAVNPWLVYHSQEARSYTLFVLMTTLSILAFYWLLRRGGLVFVVGYVVATTLMVHSHYFGLSILGMEILYAVGYLVATKSRPGLALAGVGLASLGAIPAAVLFARIVRQALSYNSGWIPPVDWTAAVSMMGDLAGLDAFGGLFLLPIFAAVWPRRTPFDAFTAGSDSQSIWSALFRLRHERLLCVAWIIFGLWVFVGISVIATPVIVVRYALPVIVPLTILGLATCKHFWRFGVWIITLLALVVYWPVALAQQTQRPGMRECVQYLRSQSEPYELLILDWAPGYNPDAVGAAYYGYAGPKMRPIPSSPGSLPSALPKERTFIISFQGADNLTDQLIEVGRPFRAKHYYFFRLYEIDSAN